MVASTVVPLSKTSQKAFITYYQSVQNLQNRSRGEFRARLERTDKAYQREVDLSLEQQRAKAANEKGDPNRFQNMTVPVVMPQVEAAVTYQTSVYLTGHPLFGVVSSPEFIDEALQLETKIENDSISGGWVRQLILFFRDGFKHNYSLLEIDWTREITYSVDTNTNENIKEGTPVEVLWTGNRLRRLDPYNSFIDPRVPPAEVHKRGEFAGYTERMSRIELKSFIATLPSKIIANVIPAFESSIVDSNAATNAGAMNYYTPSINITNLNVSANNTGMDWGAWAGLSKIRKDNIQYKDSYELTTLYAKVLPSEFELHVPNKNTPQIYKLYIVNHEVIIYAELQTNAHGWIPIFAGQPLEDGLDYQTKSLAENGKPFQELATAYMSSIISSRRRAISDRVIYDPSRISSAHINSANPSAKMPVKPGAYGKPLNEAVYAFPYREDQAASSMQQISTLLGLANTLSGQNQASQGQFVKGNKTLSEFESVMANANGRDQLASLLLESQVFVPIKQLLKLNILQFQGGTSIYNRDESVQVEIDPVALRKAVLEFKVSDGIIPSSKLLNSESFATALQVFGSSPQIAQGYNVAQLFSYFMKTQGAEISAFEKSPEQQAYEQALGSWQSLAQLTLEKEGNIEKLPPQPLPKDYNYDPKANKPVPEEATNTSDSESNLGIQ